MIHVPSKQEILEWISQNPTKTTKRDIAKAFGVTGAARIDLKRLLRELADEGHLTKSKRTYRDPDKLPPVTVLRIAGPGPDGDLMADPLEWHGEGAAPKIMVLPRAGDAALGPGDRVLARLQAVEEEGMDYHARPIRRIGTNPRRILGVFRKSAEGGRIVPIDKKDDKEWLVPTNATQDAKDGELVEAEQSGPRARMGLPKARIITRLGDPSAPKAVSLIAIHHHGIPDDFPDAVIAEADAAKPAGLKGRQDFRDMPFVTIDPADARDHDDACWAHADDDPKNPDGHILWVAIADVAYYVRPGSALDREARKRGNSSYFPDRVVPMLPDRLSGDLCSLHEGVPRAAIALRIQVDAQGHKLSHQFHRALIRSHASLTYEEVQAAMDGTPTNRIAPMMDGVIAPLYAAYRALMRARASREPLDLDLPERKIELGEDGRVTSIQFKDRLDAHRLIEEFMVLANVCAAETLIAKRLPQLFRVHEEPSQEKLDSLRDVARASGFVLAKGQVLQTRHLNKLLNDAAGSEFSELINLSTLRSMTQAYYGAQNFGHFGLALKSYSHFTSPIRRYADLIIHRGLISAHGWGMDGLSPQDIEQLEATGGHISDTERRSMLAERDTTDRYLAAYMSERVGDEFEGRISGIARFGVFVKLDDSGADGLVPMRALGREYFHYNPDEQTLMGADTGRIIRLGQRATVRLAQSVPVTGGLTFELLALENTALAQGPRKGRGKPVRAKETRDRKKSRVVQRKSRRK
jgi:ribonuclease R